MHPLLIDDLARIQISERLRDAEKRRMLPHRRGVARQGAAARTVASITDPRSAPQGNGNTMGTSTPPAA